MTDETNNTAPAPTTNDAPQSTPVGNVDAVREQEEERENVPEPAKATAAFEPNVIRKSEVTTSTDGEEDAPAASEEDAATDAAGPATGEGDANTGDVVTEERNVKVEKACSLHFEKTGEDAPASMWDGVSDEDLDARIAELKAMPMPEKVEGEGGTPDA